MTLTQSRTRCMALCALFAAMTGICSQLLIPLPMIPINLALFAVHLSGALLGPKWGPASMLVYAFLGVIGIPVFTGFQGGAAVLFGKTGGYIIGYVLDALLIGLLSGWAGRSFVRLCLIMALGVTVCYTFGTLWFMALTGNGLATSLTYCVLPFLPGDAVKIALAAGLTPVLRRRLAAK